MKPAVAILLIATATTLTAAKDSPAASSSAPADAPFPYPHPLSHPAYPLFTPTCTSTLTFPALSHTLHDLLLPVPTGLAPWSSALKSFFNGQEYPGSWDGVDTHGYERTVLRMEWKDVPEAARRWIEGNGREGKGGKLFAVYEKPVGEEQVGAAETGTPEAKEKWDEKGVEGKTVVFAPGAVYGILPLWVAGGSECEDELLDLSRYSAEPKDGGIVAWVSRKEKLSEKGKEFEFEVTAQVLKRNDDETVRDEL